MEIINFIANNAMTFLTAITVFILFYYTRETYLLRKESQKQTQIQFTPYLSLRNLDSGATLSNLGKGIALHIQVDPSIQIESQLILLIPSIGAGEDRILYSMSKNGDGAWGLITRQLPDEVGITYSDILGNNYKASFSREYKGMGVFKEVKQNKL
ncbi:MAG: hypothetical protein WC229_02455 [Candidatus Paceibacterota bacterium]|jgi:hypothetical protein